MVVSYQIKGGDHSFVNRSKRTIETNMKEILLLLIVIGIVDNKSMTKDVGFLKNYRAEDLVKNPNLLALMRRLLHFQLLRRKILQLTPTTTPVTKPTKPTPSPPTGPPDRGPTASPPSDLIGNPTASPTSGPIGNPTASPTSGPTGMPLESSTLSLSDTKVPATYSKLMPTAERASFQQNTSIAAPTTCQYVTPTFGTIWVPFGIGLAVGILLCGVIFFFTKICQRKSRSKKISSEMENVSEDNHDDEARGKNI